METIKALAELSEPDPRNRYFAVSLEKLQKAAAAAVLNERVPPNIRDHFATAQNLLIYSYYFYPFHMTAQLHAYASLEFALRIRLKPASRSEKSFKRMLREAVQKKLFEDHRFRLFPLQAATFRTVAIGEPISPVRSYAEGLAESLPKLRNDLAHGSNTLWNGSGGTLLICADLINQLFEEKDRGASHARPPGSG